jgi:hypothetical protein
MIVDTMYVIASGTVLRAAGVGVTGLRQSLSGAITTDDDGNVTADTYLYVMHIQNLTDDEFNTLRLDSSVQFLSYEATLELMATSDWTDGTE